MVYVFVVEAQALVTIKTEGKICDESIFQKFEKKYVNHIRIIIQGGPKRSRQ